MSPTPRRAQVLALAASLALTGMWIAMRDERNEPVESSTASPTATVAPLARLERELRRIDQTVWAKELLAQECGRTLEMLWDRFNAASIPDRWALLREWTPPDFKTGGFEVAESLPHGLLQQSSTGSAAYSVEAWKTRLKDWERQGFEVREMELRHRAFDVDAAGKPATSTWMVRLDVVHPKRVQRSAISGDLTIIWGDRDASTGLWRVKAVDASRLRLITGSGPAPFVPVLSDEIAPAPISGAIDPLLVHDLDGDGTPEVLLPAVNRIYRRTSAGVFRSEPLFTTLPGDLLSAVLTDFDADGIVDLLAADAKGVWWWRGVEGGRFAEPPQRVWLAPRPLINPSVLSVADVDGDGRPDLFLGQYRVPTIGQILSPNFHSAHDGHPAYLLHHEADGMLRDITDAAGLSPRRYRRVYSAVFGDFLGAGRADLALVSDFAGLDLFQNDGAGRFTDVTGTALPEAKAFGMGTAVSDFNRDGRLDLLMVGMNSATVDRLDHLNLRRLDDPTDPSMRTRMTAGNRLYFGKAGGGGFEAAPQGSDVARSGWSWGCAAQDFDNDGWPDLYVVNGQESGRTVRDYESEFWLHDLFIDRSVDDRTATSYFLRKHAATRGDGWSYGGYERNRLYLNRGGTGFDEVGGPFGVGFPEDCRNAVSADLDGDGRMDLLITTLEVNPVRRQTLRVLRNQISDPAHWIGFRLVRTPGGVPIEGTRIRVRSEGRTTVHQYVTGDSFRTQSPAALHFGLGPETAVESVTVEWPNRMTETLPHPAVDQWHSIRVPKIR